MRFVLTNFLMNFPGELYLDCRGVESSSSAFTLVGSVSMTSETSLSTENSQLLPESVEGFPNLGRLKNALGHKIDVLGGWAHMPLLGWPKG